MIETFRRRLKQGPWKTTFGVWMGRIQGLLMSFSAQSCYINVVSHVLFVDS